MRLSRTKTVLEILKASGDVLGVYYVPQVIIGYCALEHKRTGDSISKIIQNAPDRQDIGRAEYIRYCSWASRACKGAVKLGLVSAFFTDYLQAFGDDTPDRLVKCYSLTKAGNDVLELQEGAI